MGHSRAIDFQPVRRDTSLIVIYRHNAAWSCEVGMLLGESSACNTERERRRCSGKDNQENQRYGFSSHNIASFTFG
jgi:hypothetical protein